MSQDSFALKWISMDIADGECLALVGPNGSGKTTLLECIAGIRQIESGRIQVDGVDVTRLAPEKRQVGYVPQDCLLFPHLSVDRNIAFAASNRGVDSAAQVKEMMAWAGISHLAGHSTRDLSGGEKQKVALARAMIMRPKILLLDEPFSAVDRPSRVRLLGELRKSLDEISVALNLASIYVTHDLADAQLMAGQVAIMNDGSIEQVGSWDRVLQTPSSTFVADFMGFNIIDGNVTAKEGGFWVVSVKGQNIRGIGDNLTVGERVVAAVRPQAISLSHERNIRKQNWRHCQCNVLEGSIVEMREIGSVAQISIDVGFPLSLEMSSDLVEELSLTVGRDIFAQFRASEVSLLHSQHVM